MPRAPGLKDLKKRWRSRLVLATIALTLWLLMDEYVKEGYLFKPEDVLVAGTHEWIITLILASAPSALLAHEIFKRL